MVLHRQRPVLLLDFDGTYWKAKGEKAQSLLDFVSRTKGFGPSYDTFPTCLEWHRRAP